MDHVAVMKGSWGLTRKILAGDKTVESRWYKARRPPWNAIGRGDAVYFKDSGKPVNMVARVAKVIQFSDLDPRKVGEILQKYGSGIGIEERDSRKFFEAFRDKRYCILVFLKDVREVEPFYIDKSGFGLMSAWLMLDDVGKIRK